VVTGVHVAIDHGLNERRDCSALARSLFTTTLDHFLIARHQVFFTATSARSDGGPIGGYSRDEASTTLLRYLRHACGYALATLSRRTMDVAGRCSL
jgi:hypothetical protein